MQLSIKTIDQISSQNWVITPVGSLVHQTSPQIIPQQEWEMTLSGVAVINLKSAVSNDWTGEDMSIFPDINGPLQYAISHYSIPVPSNSPYVISNAAIPKRVMPLFQVEQMAAYAALGSVFDEQTAVNAGFSVNAWRPVYYLTFPGTATAPPVNNVFQGIIVSTAVHDIDAWLYRISYQITLVGKIVFVLNNPPVIP